MRQDQSQKKRDVTNKIISSYEELVELVKHTKNSSIFSLDNIEYPFNLNINKLLVDAEICMNDKETLTLTRPLSLSNVECKALWITSIPLCETDIYLIIKDSTIDSLSIYSSIFCCITIENSTINNLTIDDCHIQGNLKLDYSKLSLSTPIKVNIEDTEVGGSLEVYNLVLSDKESQFIMSGNKSAVHGDFLLYNVAVIFGKIDLSCEFKKNCVFRKVNSSLEENEGNSYLNKGKIMFNGGCLDNDLVLEYCHIHILSISNTKIGSIREYYFFFNQLQDNAATILRNCALKRGDFLLADKYTAEVYDTYLKKKAITTYKRWAYLIENRRMRKYYFRKLYQNFIWEPITLLIPSLFSSEGMLLWLNKYSNNFNRSWTRGVVFTLTTSLLAFLFLNYVGMKQPYFVFDFKFDCFGDFLKGYLSLLDIFDLTKIADEVTFELTTCGYIIFYVAKVLITFGIWQTVYAFYRYRK